MVCDSLDTGSSGTVFAKWFLLPLLMLFFFYVIVMTALEKFLRRCSTTFDKKTHKALLMQLATERGWQPKHLAGDCLIYMEQKGNSRYAANMDIIVFMVEEHRVLYTLFKKRTRLNRPSLVEIWLLHYDLKKQFRAKQITDKDAVAT